MPTEITGTLYKFLTADLLSPTGSGRWTVNEWREVSGPLVPCENGLHAVSVDNLLGFVNATLWRCEIDGEALWDGAGRGRKLVARRMRVVEQVAAWDDRAARLFAVECAERVLPLFERERPGDRRPRETLETARRFARGEATSVELAAAQAAAWAAAWAAARAAARDAAWDAAWDWQNRRLAEMLGLVWDAEAPRAE